MKSFARLCRNENGSIAIIAAFGIFILIAILALSVDHGRNYMHRSDMEAKMTSLTKVAGNEYINWSIRKKIDAAAKAAGLPGVTNPLDCNIYILCDITISDAVALAKLQSFVQEQINYQLGNTPAVCQETPQKCIVVDLPVLKSNGSTSTPANYLLFHSHRKMEANFGSIPDSSEGIAESGVLINSFNNRSIASQFVFSLDQDSKTELGDGITDYVAEVFNILQAASSSDTLITDKLQIGLTIGNVPVEGPGGGTGAYKCSNGSGIGGSGGCADTQAEFNGTDITTTPIKIQGRKYTFKGQFLATDAVTCSNPVWTYRTVLGKNTCNSPVEVIDAPFDPGPGVPPTCTYPPPPDDSVTIGDGGVTGTGTDTDNPGDPPHNPPPPPCNTSCGGVDSWSHSWDIF